MLTISSSRIYDNYAIRCTVNSISSALLMTSPTGNCQLASFSSFESLILIQCNIKGIYVSSVATLEFSEEQLQELKKLIIDICKSTGKKLMLFDVHKYVVPLICKMFNKENILLNSDYTSSNYSKMTILIINIYGS